jgi:integrase
MEKKIISVMFPNYSDDIRARVRNHVAPFIGTRPIAEITSQELLQVLRRIEASGHIDMAHRVNQICGQIFRYGIAVGICENDPTAGLKGALKSYPGKHWATITKPAEIGILLRVIDTYPHVKTRLAMIFSALTFCRPGEVRHAEWSEINNDEWRIPEGKMKMKREHIVPLSRQSMELLDTIHQITGFGRYIFPSSRTPRGDRPMSENTVLAALRSLGYTKEQMTPHGFRHMASTLLNENGFNRDWIEIGRAHV